MLWFFIVLVVVYFVCEMTLPKDDKDRKWFITPLSTLDSLALEGS